MDAIKAFNLLLKQEGTSTTLIKNDRGGLTKYGISSAAYPGLDIENLTLDEAQVIYTRDYWDLCKCDVLTLELKYAVFSCAVNCGVGSAAMILQRASKCEADGIIGPGTIASSNNITIYDFCIQWGLHYKAIIDKDETQNVFEEGWNNRITTILGWYKAGQLS